MTNAIDTMNEQMAEQLKRFGDLQQQNLEPLRAFGGVAVEAFEQMTRKHYAVAGDLIDYTFRQSALPLRGESVNDTVAAQVSEGKAFAELMNKRTAEYVELVNTLGGKFRQAGTDVATAYGASV